MEIKTFNSYEEIQEKIYIPSFQRDLNEEIVNNIKDYISECYNNNISICIGVIDLCKLNSNLYLIDGQHRFSAIKKFYEETGNDIRFHCIIYTVKSFEEMTEIFKLRNYSLPVPDFIINPPKDKGPLLREIQTYLFNLGSIFKIKSKRDKINRPYIDLHKFMEYITDSVILTKSENIEEFKKYFWQINKIIKKKQKSQTWIEKNKITEHMLEIIKEKSQEDLIYIGLYKNYQEFDDWLNI